MMKAIIEIEINGHETAVQVECGYSEDNGIITIDEVWLGAAQVRQILDDYAVQHLIRLARKDHDHLKSCHAISRAVREERKAAAREEYFNDPINKARA